MESNESHKLSDYVSKIALSRYAFRKKHCKACRLHGKSILYKQHKNNCEYKNCECEPCLELRKFRFNCRVRSYYINEEKLSPWHENDKLQKEVEECYKNQEKENFQQSNSSNKFCRNCRSSISEENTINSYETENYQGSNRSTIGNGDLDVSTSFSSSPENNEKSFGSLQKDIESIKDYIKVILSTVSHPKNMEIYDTHQSVFHKQQLYEEMTSVNDQVSLVDNQNIENASDYFASFGQNQHY